MEYIPGKDFQQIVSEENVLDYKLAVRYGAQSANGRHHAHESGMIHPDIKPKNLLVDDKGPSKSSIWDWFENPTETSLTRLLFPKTCWALPITASGADA